MGKACDLIEAAEERRRRNESVSESDKNSSSNESCKDRKSPTKSNKKVEANTSPIKLKDIKDITFDMNLKLDGSSPRKRFIDFPPSIDLRPQSPHKKSSTQHSSLVSTPDTVSTESQSLGFLGESRSGLMANSMVNLASVGLNQGPRSPMMPTPSGQDTGPPSPDSSASYEPLVKQPYPQKVSESEVFHFTEVVQQEVNQKDSQFVPVPECEIEVMTDREVDEPIVVEIRSDDSNKTESLNCKYNINENDVNETNNKVEEITNDCEPMKISQPEKLPENHKLISMDSLRYRGTDDDGVL